MLQHTYDVHEREATKLGSGTVLVVEECLKNDEIEDTVLPKELDEISEKLRDEADEIADNVEYFTVQMRVARSYDIAEWSGNDYRNAHQWALWVQENVDEYRHTEFLEQVLRARGLPREGLSSAERGFFDSVLGFEGLDAKTLSHLLASAVSKKDEADKRLECLRNAIADAIERKKLLHSLGGILNQLGGSSEDICTEAKAQALLEIHERHKYEINRLDIKEDGVADIVCWEALLALRSKSIMRERLLLLVNNGLEKGFYGSISVMNELCEWDVTVFDSYLSMLLKNLQIWSRGNEEAKKGDLNNQTGSIEEIKMMALRKRIQSVVDMTGVVGRIAEMITHEFCLRTGLAPFFRQRDTRRDSSLST